MLGAAADLPEMDLAQIWLFTVHVADVLVGTTCENHVTLDVKVGSSSEFMDMNGAETRICSGMPEAKLGRPSMHTELYTRQSQRRTQKAVIC